MQRAPKAHDSEAARPCMSRCALFSDLAAEDFDAVLKHLTRAELGDGELLFDQQQAARQIFLLERGHIKLSRLSPEGQEKIIELISPGATFAEADHVF